MLEALSQQLDRFTQKFAAAEEQQQSTQSAYARISGDIADLHAIACGLKASVDAALKVRGELEAATSPSGPVSDIKARIEKLREDFLSYSHDVQVAREQQDAIKRVQDEAMQRAAQARDVAQRVTTQLEDAGGKVARLEVAVADLAKLQQIAPRAAEDVQALNALADHVAAKTRILEKQRERAIQQAGETLERAAQLRQGAMEAASALEEQGRKLSGSIAGAEAQADKVSQLTDQLEARASGLRLAEKRLTVFEEKLASLERSEQALERSMEGLESRTKSVDAVRSDLTRIFELVEHTMEDVRAISAARQDVHSARTALDEVLQRAAAVDERAAGIDRRSREIDLAEQRIARLDALLVDVRASLEALQSQKVGVDHVLEKASQLTFVVKEAEALITTLREERDMTSKVHDGLMQLRAEEREAKAG
ncbi:MAG: hypothetical protein EXR93_05860 [Gemmatimonadetes bacterium]|nr:hypothetical protein [Gemmatimonadota bacterium]